MGFDNCGNFVDTAEGKLAFTGCAQRNQNAGVFFRMQHALQAVRNKTGRDSLRQDAGQGGDMLDIGLFFQLFREELFRNQGGVGTMARTRLLLPKTALIFCSSL